MACVQQRGLLVAIAGDGLSSIQQRMRLFGSFTPAFIAGGPADLLCRLNFAFYLAEFGVLAEAITKLGLIIHDDVVREHTSPFRTNSNHPGSFIGLNSVYNQFALIVFIIPFFWLALRAVLRHQVRLARNARRVLRTMDASAGMTARMMDIPGPGGRLLTRHTLRKYAMHSTDALLADLPWLPCFDRRDVLVVRELIGNTHPNVTPSAAPSAGAAAAAQLSPFEGGDALIALAFSAHAAARMQPAAGDDAALLSMDAWLHARSISLEALTIRASMSLRTPISQKEEGVPMNEMQALGWIPASGNRFSLIAPLGALAIASAPRDGTWSLSGATPLRRPQPNYISIGLFFVPRGPNTRPPPVAALRLIERLAFRCADRGLFRAWDAGLHSKLSSEAIRQGGSGLGRLHRRPYRAVEALLTACCVARGCGKHVPRRNSVAACGVQDSTSQHLRNLCHACCGRLSSHFRTDYTRSRAHTTCACCVAVVTFSFGVFTFLQLDDTRVENIIGGRGELERRLVAADIGCVGVANIGLSFFFFFQAVLYTIYSIQQIRHLSGLGRREQFVDISSIQHQAPPSPRLAAQAGRVQVGRFGRFMARSWGAAVRTKAVVQRDDDVELTMATSPARGHGEMGASFSGKAVCFPPSREPSNPGRDWVVRSDGCTSGKSSKRPSASASARSDVSHEQASLRSQHT